MAKGFYLYLLLSMFVCLCVCECVLWLWYMPRKVLLLSLKLPFTIKPEGEINTFQLSWQPKERITQVDHAHTYTQTLGGGNHSNNTNDVSIFSDAGAFKNNMHPRKTKRREDRVRERGGNMIKASGTLKLNTLPSRETIILRWLSQRVLLYYIVHKHTYAHLRRFPDSFLHSKSNCNYAVASSRKPSVHAKMDKERDKVRKVTNKIELYWKLGQKWHNKPSEKCCVCCGLILMSTATPCASEWMYSCRSQSHHDTNTIADKEVANLARH